MWAITAALRVFPTRVTTLVRFSLLALIVATIPESAQAQCFIAPEWSSAMAATPPDASSTGVVAGPNEPGERLVVTGRVVDGIRPVVSAVVYVFQADAQGFYIPGRGDAGAAELNPRLHATMRTDKDGRYRYETIRPGSYLGIAAHVHHAVAAPGYKTRLFDLQFKDDPILVARRDAGEPEVPQSVRNTRCFKAQPDVIAIRPGRRDAGGVWHVVRDVDIFPE